MSNNEFESKRLKKESLRLEPVNACVALFIGKIVIRQHYTRTRQLKKIADLTLQKLTIY